MKGIGIMSGSSLDGLDLALVDFRLMAQNKWNMEMFKTYELPDQLKNLLVNILTQNAWEIAKTQSVFSEFISDCILDFSEDQTAIDFCAIHGHTVLHSINDQFSWQLLNGGLICEKTSIDIICDFRNQDLALGGQGTPMAVLSDRDLFEGYDYYINLGGIANVGYNQNESWVGYDIFPFNQVFNFYAEKTGQNFDQDGKLGRKGNVNIKLVDELLNDDYIKKPYPKSIDNSWVRNYWLEIIENYKLSPEDSIRSYMEFCLQSLQNDIVKKSSTMLITGGGSHNQFFVELLQEKLNSQCVISIPDDTIIDYKEAILIAYAGYLRKLEKPNFVSQATGAKNDSIGGALYLSHKRNHS